MLGPPGAGKGTQAKILAESYGLPHISTGDIFRSNIKRNTEIGKEARKDIDQGRLVPDDVVIEIVKQRLKESDCQNGYVLDGFPRNGVQAKALDEISEVDAVINLDIDLKLLINRLTSRRVCGGCGESFNADLLEGAKSCQKCGGEIIQRDDDKEETVVKRLEVYTKQTAQLIDYYTKQHKLHNIDAGKDISSIVADIKKVLNSL